MALTVQDLIEIEGLKIQLLGGKNGTNKTIILAHTSELDDPSTWVRPNYLIMTTGLGIPRTAKKQRQYLQRLIDAEIAGLMISDKMNAPDDLSELIEMADRHDFPLLSSNYHTPFIEVARCVFDANKDDYNKTKHGLVNVLYDHTNELIKEPDTANLIQRLGELLSIELYLVDAKQPAYPLFHGEVLEDSYLEAIKQIDLGLVRIQKIAVNTTTMLHLIPIYEQQYSLIVVNSTAHPEFLQNLALFFNLYLQNRKEHFEQHLKLGFEFLDDILNERVNPVYIENKLPSFQIDLDSAVAIVAKQDPILNYRDALFNHAIHAICSSKEGHILLITDIKYIDTIAPYFKYLGVSKAIVNIKRILSAFQEASLAYKHCSTIHPVQQYAKQNYSNQSFPKSIGEAERIFQYNLGALYQYDRTKNTRYIQTLHVFLLNNRAWEMTAKQLHIHKQTLVYRINKIEETSGRKLNSTPDIVELWLALKAGEILNLIEEGGGIK